MLASMRSPRFLCVLVGDEGRSGKQRARRIRTRLRQAIRASARVYSRVVSISRPTTNGAPRFEEESAKCFTLAPSGVSRAREAGVRGDGRAIACLETLDPRSPTPAESRRGARVRSSSPLAAHGSGRGSRARNARRRGVMRALDRLGPRAAHASSTRTMSHATRVTRAVCRFEQTKKTLQTDPNHRLVLFRTRLTIDPV